MFYGSTIDDSRSIIDNYRSIIEDSRSIIDDSRSIIDNSGVRLQLAASFTIIIYDYQIFIA
jgi:hypothetical protein